MNGNENLLSDMVADLSSNYYFRKDSTFVSLHSSARFRRICRKLKTLESVLKIVHYEISGLLRARFRLAVEECSAQYCLVGHSERRQYFQENNELISKKVKRLLSQQYTQFFALEKLWKIENPELNSLLSVINLPRD